jgi:hypothetical protein
MPSTTPTKSQTTKSNTTKKPAKLRTTKANTVSKPKRAAKSPAKKSISANITNEQIAERAYQIWEANGHPCDQQESNWLQAVKELSAAA